MAARRHGPPRLVLSRRPSQPPLTFSPLRARVTVNPSSRCCHGNPLSAPAPPTPHSARSAEESRGGQPVDAARPPRHGAVGPTSPTCSGAPPLALATTSRRLRN
ncbi:hypothetical protein D4764_01G0019440 [Takifugu flavidus]|uniref:Uncharacterized protein n=1 Tax=Takifugu flavidus TaxID=433684 RepID=A0A5C6PT62_9TELE|nr:hypothetical protein D4764_01G0019440 [Takifugu flavidus]